MENKEKGMHPLPLLLKIEKAQNFSYTLEPSQIKVFPLIIYP